MIIGLAVTLVFRSSHSKQHETDIINKTSNLFPQSLFYLIVACIVLTILQIILGTQVREQIDIISKQLEGRWRERWIEQLSVGFLVHRSMSWVIVSVNGIYAWLLLKHVGSDSNPYSLHFRRLMMLLFTVVIVEISLGITMNYFAIPKAAQPLHLVSAMILFAIQWHCFLIHYQSFKKKLP